jgi:hypothetical protein
MVIRKARMLGWAGEFVVIRRARRTVSGTSCGMFKKVFLRGRSERGTEAYSFRYVEVLSDARTKRGAFFDILSVSR